MSIIIKHYKRYINLFQYDVKEVVFVNCEIL